MIFYRLILRGLAVFARKIQLLLNSYLSGRIFETPSIKTLGVSHEGRAHGLQRGSGMMEYPLPHNHLSLNFITIKYNDNANGIVCYSCVIITNCHSPHSLLGRQQKPPADSRSPSGQQKPPADSRSPTAGRSPSRQQKPPADSRSPTAGRRIYKMPPPRPGNTPLSGMMQSSPRKIHLLWYVLTKTRNDRKKLKKHKKMVDICDEKRYHEPAKSKKRIPPHDGTRIQQARRPPLIRDGPMDDGRRRGREQARQCFSRHDGRREKPFAEPRPETDA